MGEAAVICERRGPTLLLTLNRPEVRNAMNAEMAEIIDSSLEEADADPTVRAVVVTGSAGTFCSGADLDRVGTGARGGGPGATGFGGYTWHYIDKPTIAAVEGYAVGGGLEMCLASDLVVASADATFALPEVKRGFFAGADGVQRLARQMPAKVALDYLLTGRPFSAEVAHQWGLVSRLVPAGTALEGALALAEEIAANAPLAVAATKRVAHAAFDQVWSEEIARHQYSNAQRTEIRGTADFREGVAAFLEKRTPNWTGT